MRRIGELDFIVENGKLFLTYDKEKECDEWSFFTLARVPVSSIKTNISISNYKDLKRSMQLEIELSLELEKIGNEDKNKDSFSVFFFLDDEYEDELLYSISVFNLGGKNSRTNLVPISKDSELELEGLYSKLKVKILNMKPILKF
jgi:anionic cell wall polymer biosynthesis LytR-Cps2A-Psr (LCP) family protein